MAADLYIAAFLVPKTGGVPANRTAPMVPTTACLAALRGRTVHPAAGRRGRETSQQARAFHWPLEFPDVMAAGGFDVVLGNPPWERIKLQEQEFFAARDRKSPRRPMPRRADGSSRGWRRPRRHARTRVARDFETAKRIAEAASVFAREFGRFPLTGRGDVNTYALFAELFANLT